MNKIAIITVTYNAAEYLSDFLNSLNLQENKNFKVFFVDNYSSDNTLELIKKYSKFEFEIISNQANFGVAKGNNIGIKKAIRCDQVLSVLAFGDRVARFLSPQHSGLKYLPNYNMAKFGRFKSDTPQSLAFGGPKSICFGGVT